MSPASPRITRCERLADGWWVLAFACPDAARFNNICDMLKATIPLGERAWDPARRAWLIAEEEQLLRLRHVLPGLEAAVAQAAHASQREHTGCTPPPPAEHDGLTDAYAALCLTRRAPPELVTAAYRVLAKRYHPDGGGRHELMVALNASHERVMAALQQRDQPAQPSAQEPRPQARTRRP
jgi:hypothetical protein